MNDAIRESRTIVERWFETRDLDGTKYYVPCEICGTPSEAFWLTLEDQRAYCEAHAPAQGPTFPAYEMQLLLFVKEGFQVRRHDVGGDRGVAITWSNADGTFTAEQDRSWYRLTGKPANHTGEDYQ